MNAALLKMYKKHQSKFNKKRKNGFKTQTGIIMMPWEKIKTPIKIIDNPNVKIKFVGFVKLGRSNNTRWNKNSKTPITGGIDQKGRVTENAKTIQYYNEINMGKKIEPKKILDENGKTIHADKYMGTDGIHYMDPADLVEWAFDNDLDL